MRYVLVYVYHSSTPTQKTRKKIYFYNVHSFFFSLATFTIVLIVFIYIFALLSHCNYLHLEKQLYSVLIIKHLGETAAAATLHRFVPPAISLSIYKYYSFVLAPSGLFTPLPCVSVFFFLCFVFLPQYLQQLRSHATFFQQTVSAMRHLCSAALAETRCIERSCVSLTALGLLEGNMFFTR